MVQAESQRDPAAAELIAVASHLRSSFDLAERFQTPVFMLTDLDIGMNDWVTPKLAWDDAYRPNPTVTSAAPSSAEGYRDRTDVAL